MHIFETKNDIIRRGLLVATLPAVTGLVVAGCIMEGIEGALKELKGEVPGIKEDIKKIWDKPL